MANGNGKMAHEHSEWGKKPSQGESTLAGAVRELDRQHPIKCNDIGPHHGSARPDWYPMHEPAVKPNPANPYANGMDGKQHHLTVGAKK